MSRGLSVLLLACLVISTGTGTATAARALVSWSALSPPPVSASTFLDSLSCVQAHRCIVAGSVHTSGPPRAVVVRLTGRTWQRLPVPTGHVLGAVSCISLRSCEAIADDSTPYHWSGRRWVSQPGTPAGATLLSISCSSATSCAAVGQTGSSQPLVERFDGRAWQSQPILEPRLGGELFAVDCASPSVCLAVGDANQSGSTGLHLSRSLAYRYNGTSWNSSHPPDPQDAIFGQLFGIVCPTPSVCVAPSTYTNGSDENQAFADTWRNGAWQLTPVSLPAISIAQGESILGPAACLSADECIAFGTWTDADFAEHGLVETWDGSGWHQRRAALPVPSGGARDSTRVGAVSCGSSTTCIGIGSYTTKTGAEKLLVLERKSIG